jgi:mannose-6-phosphate isomerase-like protein (cupin superfamily)
MSDEEQKKLQEFLKTVDYSKFTNQPFLHKVPKPWGYELIFTPPGLPYAAKIMHIESGKRLSLQVHDTKMETYFLASGRCNLVIENENKEVRTIEMEPEKGYTVLPGQRHRHAAITDCDVYEASMPEVGNTYRLEDDFARPTETEEMRKDPNRGWNK